MLVNIIFTNILQNITILLYIKLKISYSNHTCAPIHAVKYSKKSLNNNFLSQVLNRD